MATLWLGAYVAYADAPALSAKHTATARSDTWAGVYEYEDSLGHTAPGTFAVVLYTLSVPDTQNQAQLRIQGYQVDEAILCNILMQPNGLTVKFRSYDNGKIENEYGTVVYEPDAILFILERGEKIGTFITTWKALTPDGSKLSKGEYFHLIRREKRDLP